MMKYIPYAGITDPTINLALEEYVLKHLPPDDDYLLFYVNEPSIIIGKNQNTIEEVNSEYVEQHGIHVVRRLSGGGAVYHDLGNLNFSFVTRADSQSMHNYKKFTEPVVRALRRLGVDAELSGRNDIQVGERKISGNAQYVHKGRMISHGTLLFQTDLEQVGSALKVKAAKIESKGVKSIRSRVANISEFLAESMSIDEFRLQLLRSIFEGDSTIPEYPLEQDDWDRIMDISRSRYRSWEWNYGRSPQSDISRSQRYEGVGIVDVRLNIAHGSIQAIRIFGDFFGEYEISELESKLTGVVYRREALTEAMKDIDISRYIGNLQQDLFLELLLA
jgi:lipoate---protein ligase